MQEYDFPPTRRRRRRRSKFFFWAIVAVCILGIVFFVSITLAYKFYSTSKKVITDGKNPSFIQTIKDIASSKRQALRGEEYDRINILLVGLAGKNYSGSNLTDSIIVASVNPKTYQTALLSVPRDLYVQIPNTKSYTKINALYARSEDEDNSGKTGIEDLKKTIADITGEPIDYYIALDFDGFKQIIDELDGINIQVPKDLHDERYPGPNYSYQTFDIKQGLQTLDGETALKYARTRHDEEGDFGRAYRQQQILESARSKAYSLGTLVDVPAISRILDILGEHLRTDISLDELNSFSDLVKKIDTHTTINKVLDAGKQDSVMAVSHVYMGGVRAFILLPRTGNYDEIRDIAKNIFDLELISRKKEAMKLEGASVAIVNKSGAKNLDERIRNLLEKFGYRANIAKSVEVKSFRYRQSASADASDTTVYDLTDSLKPFSLEDISKKLGAKISIYPSEDVSATCQDVDFCLVAGSDLTDKLNYEENSVEDLENGYDQQKIDEEKFFELLKRGSPTKF